MGGKITTINYSWDFTDRTHPHVSFEVLAPWIVEELELTFEPMRLAYLDGQGELAVRTVRQKDEIRGSTRELTFIRKDLLEKLVASTGLYMVTQVSGDRQFARINDFHTVKQDEDPYKDFQFYI